MIQYDQARRKDNRARGADRSKKAPTTFGQQMYPRNGVHPRHFFGNIMGYASHSHINYCLSNQILLVFSLYDLRCIILTTGKQIIAFKKGTFAPPAPPTERQEGRLLPLPSLSGVPEYDLPSNTCNLLFFSWLKSQFNWGHRCGSSSSTRICPMPHFH